MERAKLTSDRAERIVNSLRDNPRIHMTLAQLSDDAALPADELAAHLGELISHRLVVRAVAEDGLDIYRFPDEYQRGAMAPSANRLCGMRQSAQSSTGIRFAL